MIRAALVLAMLIVGFDAYAAETASDPRETEREHLVSVTGVGTSQLTPDRVVFTVGIETLGPAVAPAVDQNNTRAQSIIAALKALGVTDKEIRTSMVGIQPQYEYQEGKRPRIVGYQVTNRVTVTRDETAKVGRLLQAAIEAGANELSGLSFTVADPARGRDSGLRAAFADARARAEVLAQAAGRKLGRAVTITEGGSAPPPQPYPKFQAMARESAQMDMPVEPGAEERHFTVSVIFELE